IKVNCPSSQSAAIGQARTPHHHPSNHVKLLLHNKLNRFCALGMVNAKRRSPVICPDWLRLSTEMTTVILMTTTRRFLVLALLASLTLGPTLLGGNLLTTADAKGKGSSHGKNVKPRKVASDLSDLLGNKSGDSLVKVILQLEQKPSGQLNALLAANGVKIRRHFSNLNSFALEIPARLVDTLSSFSEVSFVSLDSEVRTMGGHVAHTTGADNVRLMSADGALDGSGIGIAIVDSGIFGQHTSFVDT